MKDSQRINQSFYDVYYLHFPVPKQHGHVSDPPSNNWK